MNSLRKNSLAGARGRTVKSQCYTVTSWCHGFNKKERKFVLRTKTFRRNYQELQFGTFATSQHNCFSAAAEDTSVRSRACLSLLLHKRFSKLGDQQCREQDEPSEFFDIFWCQVPDVENTCKASDRPFGGCAGSLDFQCTSFPVKAVWVWREVNTSLSPSTSCLKPQCC